MFVPATGMVHARSDDRLAPAGGLKKAFFTLDSEGSPFEISKNICLAQLILGVASPPIRDMLYGGDSASLPSLSSAWEFVNISDVKSLVESTFSKNRYVLYDLIVLYVPTAVVYHKHVGDLMKVLSEDDLPIIVVCEACIEQRGPRAEAGSMPRKVGLVCLSHSPPATGAGESDSGPIITDAPAGLEGYVMLSILSEVARIVSDSRIVSTTPSEGGRIKEKAVVQLPSQTKTLLTISSIVASLNQRASSHSVPTIRYYPPISSAAAASTTVGSRVPLLSGALPDVASYAQHLSFDAGFDETTGNPLWVAIVSVPCWDEGRFVARDGHMAASAVSAFLTLTATSNKTVDQQHEGGGLPPTKAKVLHDGNDESSSVELRVEIAMDAYFEDADQLNALLVGHIRSSLSSADFSSPLPHLDSISALNFGNGIFQIKFVCGGLLQTSLVLLSLDVLAASGALPISFVSQCFTLLVSGPTTSLCRNEQLMREGFTDPSTQLRIEDVILSNPGRWSDDEHHDDDHRREVGAERTEEKDRQSSRKRTTAEAAANEENEEAPFVVGLSVNSSSIPAASTATLRFAPSEHAAGGIKKEAQRGDTLRNNGAGEYDRRRGGEDAVELVSTPSPSEDRLGSSLGRANSNVVRPNHSLWADEDSIGGGNAPPTSYGIPSPSSTRVRGGGEHLAANLTNRSNADHSSTEPNLNTMLVLSAAELEKRIAGGLAEQRAYFEALIKEERAATERRIAEEVARGVAAATEASNTAIRETSVRLENQIANVAKPVISVGALREQQQEQNASGAAMKEFGPLTTSQPASRSNSIFGDATTLSGAAPLSTSAVKLLVEAECTALIAPLYERLANEYHTKDRFQEVATEIVNKIPKRDQVVGLVDSKVRESEEKTQRTLEEALQGLREELSARLSTVTSDATLAVQSSLAVNNAQLMNALNANVTSSVTSAVSRQATDTGDAMKRLREELNEGQKTANMQIKQFQQQLATLQNQCTQLSANHTMLSATVGTLTNSVVGAAAATRSSRSNSLALDSGGGEDNTRTTVAAPEATLYASASPLSLTVVNSLRANVDSLSADVSRLTSALNEANARAAETEALMIAKTDVLKARADTLEGRVGFTEQSVATAHEIISDLAASSRSRKEDGNQSVEGTHANTPPHRRVSLVARIASGALSSPSPPNSPLGGGRGKDQPRAWGNPLQRGHNEGHYDDEGGDSMFIHRAHSSSSRITQTLSSRGLTSTLGASIPLPAEHSQRVGAGTPRPHTSKQIGSGLSQTIVPRRASSASARTSSPMYRGGAALVHSTAADSSIPATVADLRKYARRVDMDTRVEAMRTALNRLTENFKDELRQRLEASEAKLKGYVDETVSAVFASALTSGVKYSHGTPQYDRQLSRWVEQEFATKAELSEAAERVWSDAEARVSESDAAGRSLLKSHTEQLRIHIDAEINGLKLLLSEMANNLSSERRRGNRRVDEFDERGVGQWASSSPRHTTDGQVRSPPRGGASSASTSPLRGGAAAAGRSMQSYSSGSYGGTAPHLITLVDHVSDRVTALEKELKGSKSLLQLCQSRLGHVEAEIESAVRNTSRREEHSSSSSSLHVLRRELLDKIDETKSRVREIAAAAVEEALAARDPLAATATPSRQVMIPTSSNGNAGHPDAFLSPRFEEVEAFKAFCNDNTNEISRAKERIERLEVAQLALEPLLANEDQHLRALRKMLDRLQRLEQHVGLSTATSRASSPAGAANSSLSMMRSFSSAGGGEGGMAKANGKVVSLVASSGRHITDLNASKTALNKSIDKISASNSTGKRKEENADSRESGGNGFQPENNTQYASNQPPLFVRAPNPSSGTRQPSPVS